MSRLGRYSARSGWSRLLVLFGFSLAAVALCSSHAMATYLPSIKIGIAALISPTSANSYYVSFPQPNKSTDGLAQITGVATPTPPEIVELARALKNNPDLIYQYVRNNIQTTWMYGLQKGALGAEIDKSGTPFDQAELMVALLRQAGYTTKYVAGTVLINETTTQGFSKWTGITNARAACQLLANGGIPATVNGVNNALCSTIASGDALATVQMAHIWVQVTIPGSHSAGCATGDLCVFDPSYKVYNWKPGINLAAAMSFTPGTLLSDAKTGSFTSGTKGVSPFVPYANALNASALNSDLQGYASNLLTYLQSNHLQGAQLEDIISGGVIVPDNSTVRQGTLPYADPSPPYTVHVWTPTIGRFNAIPDHYRATLTVEGKTKQYSGGVQVDAEMFNPTKFFADEIYGRRLTVETDFTSAGIGTTQPNYYKQNACIALDAQSWNTWPAAQCLVTYSYTPPTGLMARDLPTHFLLSADHPYAASASGGTSTTGDYMDATADKQVKLITPLTIVHSWGETSQALFAKWSEERASDDPLSIYDTAPLCPGGGAEHDLCPQFYLKTTGGFIREKTAAGWLAQFSRAARMNAALANVTPQLHHTLGVVFGDADLVGTSISPFTPPGITIGDNFDRIDIDAGISFTSKTTSTAAANARRGALMAFAASSATLEGSMPGQLNDLPDTSSTATRFEWGNSPDSDHTTNGQNPFSIGPQDFYQYDSGNYSQAGMLSAVDGAVTGSCSGVGLENWGDAPTLTSTQCTGLTGAVASWVSQYASNGFKVVASREAFLGPGQRGGLILPVADSHGVPIQYTHYIGHQRGGAFVALKLDSSGDPTEIAHIIVDGNGITKGGGGGTQPDSKGSYDPATAADILKSRFVDRSSLLGVNLSNGSLGSTSAVSLSVGNGGFPYELTASLSWHPATPPNTLFAPVSPIVPQPGWTNSWGSSLTFSGSGVEAMGQSDIRGAIGAIVTFYGAQDVYQATQAPEREAAAVLVEAWWSHQLQGNVVTVNLGGETRQFLKIATGAWILPGASYAVAAQTNNRTPFQDKCFHVQADNTPYALSRGWDASSVSFTTTNAHGDQEHYGYFDNGYYTDDDRVCGHLRGFRLTNWTFPQGMMITPTYSPITVGLDTFDALSQVNNSIGRGLIFNPTSIAENAGTRSITLSDASGLPASMTDAMGKATSYTYTPPQPLSATQRPVPFSLLASVTTPEHPSQHNAEYYYDALGRIEQVYDATAIQRPATGRGPYNFYLADGTRGERDDPQGQAYSVVYDTYGHPSRYIDEVGIETDVFVDSRNRPTQYAYPEGDCEVFAYDDHNNPTDFWKVDKTSSCSTAAGPTHVLHVSAAWDSTWNKPLTVTNARGYTTTLTYYSSGSGTSLLHTATRPTIDEGTPVYAFAYDAAGRPTDMTGPTGIVTHNDYDSSESLTSITDDYGTSHLNLKTQFLYDTDANVQTVIDPRGNAATLLYDADRRKTEDHHHDGNPLAALNAATKTVYDEIGRVTDEQQGTAFSGTTVTTWLTVKHSTYTPTSKTETVTDADGRTTTTAYDNGDRLLTVSDPIGRNIHFDYCHPGDANCAANQVKTEYRAWSSGTACSLTPPSLQECYRRVTYGSDGELATMEDANNNVTTYAYNGFNRLTTTTFPDASYEQLGLDENGNVVSRRTRAGQTLTYIYNALDWIKQRTMPVPPSSNVITNWTYLLDSRIDTLVDNAGTGNTIDYGYDGAGRVNQIATKIPGISNKTVNYVLDANGNRTKLTWPGGSYFVGYCYDSLNRMNMAMENSTSSGCATNLLATYQYDALSRRTNLTYAGAGAQVQTPDPASYSAAGDLLSLAHVFQSGTGNNNTYTYAYTGAHQILTTAANNAAWLWQPSTNSSTGYTVNTLNQYSSVNSTTYAYDGNGNLMNDGVYAFAYDAENRLLTACAPSPCTSPTMSVIYSYDPLGRRTKKTGTGVTETYYLSDGTDEIAEYDTSSNVTSRYVPGSAVDRPIARVTGAGVRSFFHTDNQGSVIAMSDMSGAMIEGPYTYDPYGNCTSAGSPCSSTGVAYRFTGRRLDAEIGCYYYRARYYCPDDKRGGRFLQTDSVGYSVDLDLYTYVANDPTNKTDPTGAGLEPNGGSSSDCNSTDSSFTHCYPGQGYQNSGSQGGTKSAAHAGATQLAQEETADDITETAVENRDEAIENARRDAEPPTARPPSAPGVGLPRNPLAIRPPSIPPALDTITLGRFPGYVYIGALTNSRTFDVPEAVYKAMSVPEQWEANVKFLNEAIANGSIIRLSSPPSAAVPGTAFARELNYLEARGFTVNEQTMTVDYPANQQYFTNPD